ncbi:MAG: hypothetical protein U9R28_02895 [Pseudomonadota bacterium]|nr:hypothetical protein [Pseudomonadota bacterium]
MLLNLMNVLAGLFGYEWVKDNRPIDEPEEDIIADEGWDDLHQHSPRYRLQKKQ